MQKSHSPYARDFAQTPGTIRQNPPLFIAFSVYRMLGTAIFTGLIFFRSPFTILGLERISVPAPATTLLLFMCAATFSVLAFNARNIHPTGKPLISYAAAALLALGLLFARAGRGYFPPTALGALFAAVGFCVLHIELGRIAGFLGTSKTLMYTAASSLFGILLFVLLYMVPQPFDIAYAAACLAVLAHMLEKAKTLIGRNLLFVDRHETLHIPYRFILTSFVQGMTIGIACTMLHVTTDIGVFLQTWATIGACIVAFITVIILKINYDRLIYRMGFLSMGAGMLLFAVAGTPAGRTFALLIQNCAFIYLDLVLWSFGAYLIKNLNQPAIWSTCCPTASLMGGRFIGTAIGLLLLNGNTVFDMLTFNQNDVAAVLAFGIVASALLLSSTKNIQSGWGFVRPGEPDDTISGTRELACQSLSSDFSLTERESEVLELLAQGKLRREIAESLCVSDNTVKTHIRSIYNKLDVHSRDELNQRIFQNERPFESHE